MLSVRGLRVVLGDTVAVDEVDLDLAAGRVLAVLGPSGCGKSTLLRTIAGLERADAGQVCWDGVDVTATPTHRRGFALMFQDGQLFDHLTVARNVAYAPRLRGRGRRAAAADVDDLLELVGLGGYGPRLPRTLSGGERQRVALARSLAAQPRLLLLDEPLSALDADLRARLADDLRRILTDAGTTALFVTHDQDEAFAVADELAVMRGGRIVQHGAAAAVWANPVDADTARFLGYPLVVGGGAAHRVARAGGVVLTDAREALVAVRAAGVRVRPPSEGQRLRGRVVMVRGAREGTRVEVDVEGVGVLPGRASADWVPAPGDDAEVEVTREALAVLPAPDGSGEVSLTVADAAPQPPAV